MQANVQHLGVSQLDLKVICNGTGVAEKGMPQLFDVQANFVNESDNVVRVRRGTTRPGDGTFTCPAVSRENDVGGAALDTYLCTRLVLSEAGQLSQGHVDLSAG